MRTYSTISALTAAKASAQMFVEVAPYWGAEIVAVFEGKSFRAYNTPVVNTHKPSLYDVSHMNDERSGYHVLVFVTKDWKGKTYYVITSPNADLNVYTVDGTTVEPVVTVERPKSLLERAREFVFGAASRKPLEGPLVVSRYSHI